ncbi:MAG: HAD-IA family hydrolase, partial [Alphaproteobacteria bacterium]|nr:HAD-IA family hydrolase [Alphaproteobacteria bacterium]
MTAKFSILSKKIISFDIFDTLLVRPYANPNGIFLHLEKLYNKQGFPLARKMAERKAIQNTTEEEITFDEIYDNIEDEYKFLKDKEEELEINTIQPNPEIKKLYDFAIKHNKKVIITSDMYLPKETILKILHKNGYNNFYKLYLSSDIKKTKHSGNLFKYIIDELKVKPSQILHIGDNEIADIQNAKKLGIKTLLIPKISDKFLKKNKSFQSINTNNLFSSILLGINSIHYINNKKEKFYNKLGYQLTAPLTYSYTKFIESECKNKNISQLFFIARDGYILN